MGARRASRYPAMPSIHRDLAHAHLEHVPLGRHIVSYLPAMSRARERGRAGVGLQRQALLTTTDTRYLHPSPPHHDSDA